MSIALTKSPPDSSPKNKKPTGSGGAGSGGSGSDGSGFSLSTYFKGLKAEWGRITWPSRPQILSETMVVIAVVAFFTTFIFLVDKLFQFLVTVIT